MTTHIKASSDRAEAGRLESSTIPTSVLDELRSTATVSVGRTAELLGISRGHAYNLVKAGGLPVIRLGAKRMRVPSIALLRLLTEER